MFFDIFAGGKDSSELLPVAFDDSWHLSHQMAKAHLQQEKMSALRRQNELSFYILNI